MQFESLAGETSAEEDGDPPDRLSLQASEACRVDISFDTLWEEEKENFCSFLKALVVRMQEELVFPREAILEYVFSHDTHVRSLNAQYRGKDTPTNVLSFPLASQEENSPPLLGTVVFAYETIHREAKEQQKPFSHHSKHLIVHGTLHLLGLTHKTSEEAEVMEGYERRILNTFRIPDPYEAFEGK
ncbi:MAG: rRNA maturation RNase YbeY [Holosporales bacterium]|jgi:probable rRNA maturation factor|nr:rRNA maturation RNase YbeY [Holosporales bacterium]